MSYTHLCFGLQQPAIRYLGSRFLDVYFTLIHLLSCGRGLSDEDVNSL